MNLTAKLILDDKEYTVQLQEAKQKTENVTNTTEKMGLSAKLTWASVGVAIAGVVKKMGELMYNTTEYAGSIKDLAQVYETTYQNVQELNYIAQESGKNAEWVLRKARSSGQSYAEVLGLTNEEYQEMISNAKEMGLVLEDEVIDRADVLGEQIASLKYQWQSVLTGLLAGTEDSEQQLEAYFERLGAFIEAHTPMAVRFTFKLLTKIAQALVSMLPELLGGLVGELIDYLIEYTLSFDWIGLGWNIGLEIAEGILNGLGKLGNKVLKYVGIEIPEADFDRFKRDLGTNASSYSYSTNNSNSSNVTNNTTITIEAKDANAREIANEVSRILSTQIQAKGR